MTLIVFNEQLPVRVIQLGFFKSFVLDFSNSLTTEN